MKVPSGFRRLRRGRDTFAAQRGRSASRPIARCSYRRGCPMSRIVASTFTSRFGVCLGLCLAGLAWMCLASSQAVRADEPEEPATPPVKKPKKDELPEKQLITLETKDGLQMEADYYPTPALDEVQKKNKVP